MSRIRIVVSFLAMTGLAASAAAQPVIFNGSFTNALRGWRNWSEHCSWSERDAHGAPDSGSLAIVNLGSTNYGRGADACVTGVAFAAGEQYELGGYFHVPAGQSNFMQVGVGLNWYGQPGCEQSLESSDRAYLTSPNSDFEKISVNVTVPAGVQSVKVVTFSTKMGTAEPLLAYVDELYLVRLGEQAPARSVIVPAAAHIRGYGGTAWRTDLEVHNPTDANVAYTVDLLKRDQANPQPQQWSSTLAPGASVRLRDVVMGTFSLEGAAALRVVAASGRLVVTSRTFNDAGSSTFGQFVPGLPEETSIVYGQKVRLSQLTQNLSTTTGFRTNIGLVNTGPLALSVTVSLHASDATLVGTRMYDLDPYEYRQVDKIYTAVTGSEIQDGYAIVETTTEGARFMAYAAVVDNASGDAICVQPAL